MSSPRVWTSDPVELKMLAHSPVGHGKTHLLGTAVNDERLMPAVLGDFEGGYRTIRSKCVTVPLKELKHVKDPPLDKIIRVRLNEWEDIDELYDVLQQDDQPFRSFFGDSLSEINFLSLDGVVKAAFKKKPADHDEDVATQQDYLKSIAQMRKLIRYFRDLERLHIVFTATTMDIEDARTRRGKAQPNFIGKLTQEVPALVDWVGYLALAETQDAQKNPVVTRVLITQPSDRYVAKGRNDPDDVGQLPGFLENPTLPLILDHLEGKIKTS